MYNGDIVIMGPNGIRKSNNIQSFLNGEVISLPTGTFNQSVNKQVR